MPQGRHGLIKYMKKNVQTYNSVIEIIMRYINTLLPLGMHDIKLEITNTYDKDLLNHNTLYIHIIILYMCVCVCVFYYAIRQYILGFLITETFLFFRYGVVEQKLELELATCTIL